MESEAKKEAAPTEAHDDLQDILWCYDQIVKIRRIKKRRHPVGLLLAEINAYMEIRTILDSRRKGL